MTHQSHKDDTKLLLAVAGTVVLGAAAFAIMAGLGSAREAEAKNDALAARRGAVHATVRVEPEPTVDDGAVMLATSISPTASVLSEPDSAMPESAFEAPQFSIGPSENLVAGAVAAWSRRDYPRSIAYFTAQTEARPDDAWAHYMLGLSYWKSDRLDEAVESLTLAAGLNPVSIKTPINLSRVQNDRGDFEAALIAAETALAIDREDATALFLLGRSQRNLGRIDAAVAALEASLARDFENGFAHNLLGLIRIERGELDEAIVSLSHAAVIRPNVAFIQNNLGTALERTGDRVGALAAFRRAMELDSTSGKAAVSFARLEPLVPNETQDARESEDSGVAVASIDSGLVIDEGERD